jgi:hypothetical protein
MSSLTHGPDSWNKSFEPRIIAVWIILGHSQDGPDLGACLWYAQCIAKRDTKHFLVKVEEAFTSTLLVTGGNHERHVSRRAIRREPRHCLRVQLRKATFDVSVYRCTDRWHDLSISMLENVIATYEHSVCVWVGVNDPSLCLGVTASQNKRLLHPRRLTLTSPKNSLLALCLVTFGNQEKCKLRIFFAHCAGKMGLRGCHLDRLI